MKIIDLLNKIANGEEAPKKIKIKDEIWTYDDDIDYKAEDDREYLLKVNIRLNEDLIVDKINEIIEKDKKIKRIGKLNQVEDKQNLNNYMLRDKINEIIDKLNKEE